MFKKDEVRVDDILFEKFIDTFEIQEVVKEIATKINTDYQTGTPLIVPVLNGAFIFAADLIRHLWVDCQLSFIKATSYDGTNSGDIQKKFGLDLPVAGRQIIIVEDIVDSGNTLCYLQQEMERIGAEDVKIASLLFKPKACVNDVKIDYLGRNIDNKFVVGYGMDYNGLGRNLPAIYQARDDVGKVMD